jgi:hypothetical protein
VKLQCELCREIVVAELAIVDAHIEVHCPSCNGTFTAEAKTEAKAGAKAAAPKPPEPAAVVDGPSMRCPKCGLDQREADACRACGLLAARMADFTARDLAGAPPEVAAAWDRCLAGWSDAGRHEALAIAAAAHDAYPWVARRYHERLRADPDDAIAAAREAAIGRIAEASLRASAGPRKDRPAGVPGAPSPTPYRSTMTVLIALVVLAATGTIYALVAAPSSSDTATAAPIPVQPQHHR